MVAMRPGCQTTSKREGRFNSHCRLSLPFSGRASAYLLNFPTTKSRLRGSGGWLQRLTQVLSSGDYLRDANGFHVVKTVWAEFMSTDPSREVRWASVSAWHHRPCRFPESRYRENSPFLWLSRARPFSPPAFGLAPEQSFTALCDSVRRMGWQSLAGRARVRARPWPALRDWDLQFAVAWLESRGEFLSRYSVHSSRNGLADRPIRCWPSGLEARYESTRWLSECCSQNFRNGVHLWDWLDDWPGPPLDPRYHWVIQTFKPERCMFASHMPIASLACSFQDLYHAYLDIVQGSVFQKRGSSSITLRLRSMDWRTWSRRKMLYGYPSASIFGKPLRSLGELSTHARNNLSAILQLPWGKLLSDVPAAGAILDRLLHHAEIIAITGRSYRLQSKLKEPAVKTNRTTADRA